MFSRRTLDVGVAVVFEPSWGFFLGYNPRWHGYTFPMRKRRMTDVDLGHTALEALREATDLPLRGATYRPLVALEIEGESHGTGKRTRYRYHAFEIDPPVLLSAEIAPHGFGCRRGFLKPDQIAPPALDGSTHSAAASTESGAVVMAPLGADLVTWSTRRLVEELVGNQRVALAVICRRGAEGPEFLMSRNASYGGYFPIAGRCRTEAQPGYEVREAIRADIGYPRRPHVGGPLVREERHFSPRFQCERHFVHTLFPVTFPGVDLHDQNSELNYWLERSGLLWRWVAVDELENPAANDLSPTIANIRDGLRQIARQIGCE